MRVILLSEIDKLTKLLKNHEKRISDLEDLLKSKSSKLSLDGEKVIIDLISDGFFDTKKKLGDISKELKSQAKFNKSHKYSKILENLTREGKLTRKMSGHQWWYTKK